MRSLRIEQALYDDVVARYSSPATASLGRLLLPYLFPELSAFAIVEDLPPMFITLYFIVTRLPDSLRSVRDHFLSLDPTVLTIDLLEQHLLAPETSVVAVGAARGTPRTPFFEGCSPSPLAPSYASSAPVDVPSAEDVGAASASAKRRSSKGKGGKGGGGGSGSGGGGNSGGGGGSGGGGSGGSGGGSGGFGGGGGGIGGSGGSGSSGSGGGRTGAQRGGSGGGQRQRQQRRSETLLPQQLREWLFQRGASGGSVSCPYVIRTGDRAGQTCGKPHTQHRCFSRLDDAWRAEFGDEVERPHWAELLRSGVAIFDLDCDAILSAMYALSASAEGDCYQCVPPDPGIEAAALGASESSLPGTAPAEALHTFMLDSGALRCFFRDSTTLTPLPAPVPVRLADPSKGPVVAHSSTILPCPTVLSGSLSTLHLPSFSTNLVSTAALHDSMVTTTTPGVRLQLRERFHQDLPVLRLHSDRGGEFSSDLLWDFCRREGILQSLTLPESPQQNGIGLVMEVARTSMIRFRSGTLRISSSFGPVSPCRRPHPHCVGQGRLAMRRCYGSGALVPSFAIRPRTSSPPVLSPDVTFDKSVPFYRLIPYHSAPPPPSSLFLAPGPPPVDPLPPQGPAPSGVSQVDPLPSTVPVEVAGDSGAARVTASGGATSRGAEPGGAESKGAGSGGAEPRGTEPGGAELGGDEPAGVEPRGAEPVGVEPGGAEPRGAALSGGPTGASPRLSPRPEPLSPQQLRDWLVRRVRLRSEAAGAGATGGTRDTRAGGAGVTAGAGGTRDPTEPGAAGAGGAGAGSTGAGDAGAGGAGAGGTGAGGAGARGAGVVDPAAGGARAGGAVSGGTSAGGTSQPPLQPASPLPAPSPYIEQSSGLTERREPASRLVSPVRTTRCFPRPRPPPVLGTHAMAFRPSSVPLRVPLSPPPESSLPAVPDPESGHSRAASPTVSHLLATVVTDPSFESTAASALVAKLVDFSAACRLDYATALVAEPESASPPSVGGECALGTDDLEDRQEDFECLVAAAAMDAEMASWKSTSTYVDAVPPSRANIVDGMCIFGVKQPPGSPPAFKARYVARVFRQRQGVDYFHTFSPTAKMTTLWVLLHVAAQHDYELHSLDFGTDFLQGSLHEEIWLRCPHGFTESFPAGTQWSLRRPVYGLRQAPRKWHDTLRTTLVALGFTPSTADPSLFLRTDTSLPPFYVLVYVDDLVFSTADTEALTLDLQRFGFQFFSPQPTPLSTSHSLPAPPSDESVEPSGPYLELVGCLITSGMGLLLGGLGPVVLTGHADASWVDDSATQQSSLGYTFSLGSGSVSWRSTRSSSVLSSSCEAEIYAGAMAAQELRWLTYLLTDLGEEPRSPPVLYVDNKAMIALCQEHKLEHRTKHIAL
ncbi:unnamed protein product [Closterium sp. NIES-54]